MDGRTTYDSSTALALRVSHGNKNVNLFNQVIQPTLIVMLVSQCYGLLVKAVATIEEDKATTH